MSRAARSIGSWHDARRVLLANTTLVGDYWHLDLHRLAELMVAQVRQWSPSSCTAPAAEQATTSGPTGGCCSATDVRCLVGSWLDRRLPFDYTVISEIQFHGA